MRADAKGPEPVHKGQPLSHWIKALQDANPKVRLQAATALGKTYLKESPAISALIERFQDEDKAVCQAAAVALGGSLQAMPALCRGLTNKDPRVRRWSAFAIRHMRRVMGGLLAARERFPKISTLAQAKVSTLMAAVADQNAEVRGAVISVLGAIGPMAKPAVPQITAALKDPNKFVRTMAAVALWWIDRQTNVTVPILIEGLEDKGMDLEDRKGCAWVLGEMGPKAKAAVPELIAALRGIGKTSRTTSTVALASYASEALGRMGEPAVPALTKALRDEDAEIRKNAAWALFRMGPKAKGAVPALIAKSKDAQVDVRRFAIGALAKIGPAAREAVPALIERLKDEHGGVRRNAGWALGHIGAPAKDAVPTLIVTLNDKDKAARDSAVWALGRIGPPAKAAVPALIEALKIERHSELAAEALGRIGANAKAAVPTLGTLLEQSRGATKIKVALAFWRITGQEAKALPVLTAALQDRQAFVRRDAADALAEMGPKAKAAVPGLIALMERKSPRFYDRRAAYQALKKIDPQAAYQALKKIDPQAAKKRGKP
jgi:HEAT repeat protein